MVFALPSYHFRAPKMLLRLIVQVGILRDRKVTFLHSVCLQAVVSRLLTVPVDELEKRLEEPDKDGELTVSFALPSCLIAAFPLEVSAHCGGRAGCCELSGLTSVSASCAERCRLFILSVQGRDALKFWVENKGMPYGILDVRDRVFAHPVTYSDHLRGLVLRNRRDSFVRPMTRTLTIIFFVLQQLILAVLSSAGI